MYTSPDYTKLPSGFEIVPGDGKFYLKFDGAWIVTEASGTRRSFRGTDDTTRKRVVKCAWRFCNGFWDGYRSAYPGENVL